MQPTGQPTGQPTMQPTGQPTGSSSLSIVPSVSKIRVVNATGTNITLSVLLIKNTVGRGDSNGGTLYCAAILNGNTITSVGSVVSAQFDGSTSKGASTTIPTAAIYPLNLKMTISNMAALQVYAVYCYVQTLSGTGNSLVDVVSTKTYASTTCCKLVSYSNAPAFVFADISKYSSSSVPSSYLFSYILSDPPASYLMITPTVFYLGMVVPTVTAMPKFYNITRSSLLTGQFYLSGGSTLNGPYTITLKYSGPSARQYSTTNITVLLLSSHVTLPAPIFLSSQFSDSGQAVIFSFNTPTDLANITSHNWFCSILFKFFKADSTQCTWTNSTSVSATFGIISATSLDDRYLSIGDDVTLIAGKLRAFCTDTRAICLTNANSPATRVFTLAPRNPLSPTVIISAPSQVGACTTLTLDATGSFGNGGRPYSAVTWNVTAYDYEKHIPVDALAIQSILNTYSLTNQVRIPILIDYNFTKATYSFSLSLKNFLGQSSTSKTVTRVTVTADRNLPALSVLGPSHLQVLMSSVISIQSAATLPVCASKRSNIVYTWTVYYVEGRQQIRTIITTMSRDSSRFLLPPYQLTVDSSYLVNIKVVQGSSSSNSYSSSNITVYVAHGKVNAAVLGGYARASPINEQLTLDASISTDDDESTSVNLNYKVQHGQLVSQPRLYAINSSQPLIIRSSLTLYLTRHSGPAP
jgi:REJ domain/PT repeat